MNRLHLEGGQAPGTAAAKQTNVPDMSGMYMSPYGIRFNKEQAAEGTLC